MMCKTALILSCIFTLALISTAFPQAQPQQAQPQQAQPQQAQPPPPPQEEPPPVFAVPKEYRYNARGRRDPFVNPIPKPANPGPSGARAPAAPNCPQSQGLKGVLLAQAAIAGVVTAKDPYMTIAVIGAPGGKSYFARVGDALCDAVVKTIKLEAVTFVLTVPGIDEKASREVERKVRPTSGEQK